MKYKILTATIIGILVILTGKLMLNSFADSLLFYPEKLPDDYKFSLPFAFQEIRLDEEGNSLKDSRQNEVSLHGIYIKSAFPKNQTAGTILYFHGNAGSLRTWAYIYEDFQRYPYHFLIADYRGFGKSTGKRSEQNMFSDALVFYDYLENKMNEKNIILYGRSIGSAMAVYAAAERKPGALILETPFLSVKELARNHMPFLAWLPMPYSFNNEKRIRSIEEPVYIFHGTEDEIVPFVQGQKLHQLRLNRPSLPSEFYSIRNGSHNNLNAFPEFHEAMKSVLREVPNTR